ncbi:MAG: efflux RND transporter periplasmic adaptor subunit [Deltaproteobacteria bacterium]|nr:efflux RND transporter periplasmic adaptor subunit [Deltaproteobacteria bacterium]
MMSKHDDTEMQEGEEAPPKGVRTMAIVRWLLVLLMAAIATVSIASYFGAFTSDAPSDSATRYICPMHPSVVSDRPAECSICGMALVLESSVEASSQTGSDVPGLAPLTLEDHRVQLLGLKTEAVTFTELDNAIRTVGVLQANENGLATITTRFSGYIEKLYVSETGRAVKQGDALATIYSPELLAAQQDLINAAKWLREGQATTEQLALAKAARERLELLGVAAQELDAIARTGVALKAVPIRSPVSGVVLQRSVVQGAAVQAGAALFDIADLSTVWLVASVYEVDASRVRVGQKATLHLAAFGERDFRGRVQFIYPTLEADSRTLRVRLEFPNARSELRPNMYGDVAIGVDAVRGLVVPREAVVDTGEMTYVFVATGEGRFEPRRVKLGLKAKDRVQVKEGVKEGDAVVSSAGFLLDSESRIRAAFSRGKSIPASPPQANPRCERDFDRGEPFERCVACSSSHGAHPQMLEDCLNAIPKPWKKNARDAKP